MTKTKKKLALATETLVVLSADDLPRVAGGRRSLCTYEQSGCLNGTEDGK